jgi:hypothetical protein
MGLGLPLILFSILLLPFLGVFPYLDGNTEFVIAHNFYSGNYLTNWVAYHPPLKPIMASLLFQFFGVSGYTLLGYILGLVGIASIYAIAQTIFDKKTAILSAVFLALSGLYVSTSLFSLNDFIMTVFILLSYAMYVRKKFFAYAIIVSLAVCAKESAILFPVSIAAVELFHKKFRWEHVIPILILCDWILFLRITGHGLWNSWNFSGSQQHGILYTFFDNLITLKIFNQYAYDNWRHLFIFNYNWVFWIIAALAVPKLKRNQHFQIMLLFAFSYAAIVLSFQTYTITRYILPILPFVYIIAAYYLVKVRYAPVVITLLMVIVLSGLFTSNDPFSNQIWNKRTVLNGGEFYSRANDGMDGITYNMQFLQLTKKRDTIIRTGNYKNRLKELNINPTTLALYNLDK